MAIHRHAIWALQRPCNIREIDGKRVSWTVMENLSGVPRRHNCGRKNILKTT